MRHLFLLLIVIFFLFNQAYAKDNKAYFPLDLTTLEKIQDGEIAYEVKGNQIFVTHTDRYGDAHIHLLSHEGISQEEALDILSKKKQQLDNIFTVKRVIDGDTLELETGEQVKLIGIVCPEADTEQGKMALDCVATYIKQGQNIRLEFDGQQKDEHGRLLAYVYVFYSMNDGTWLPPQSVHPGVWSSAEDNVWRMFLNAYIVQQGYASPLIVSPNTKYADLFEKLYQEARENKRGLWKEAKVTPTPICPKCGSKDVAKIFYGLPTYQLTGEAEHGDVVSGGSIVADDSPHWMCKTCKHRW